LYPVNIHLRISVVDNESGIQRDGISVLFDGSSVDFFYNQVSGIMYIFMNSTPAGTHTVQVFATDSSNNTANTSFAIQNIIPSEINTLDYSIVDEDLLLSWTSSAGSYPISEYRVLFNGNLTNVTASQTVSLTVQPGSYMIVPVDTEDIIGKAKELSVSAPVCSLDIWDLGYGHYQFNLSLSLDPDGNISSIMADLGDGTTVENLSVFTHFYNDSGPFTVVFSVVDEDGFEDVVSHQIVVDYHQVFFADFVFSPTDPDKGEVISFLDISFDPDRRIVNWTWDFGDGNMSYEQHPTHSYGINGSYNVSLTIRDGNSIIDMVSDVVPVNFCKCLISFDVGWNLITVPLNNVLLASDLAANISGCEMISWYDCENQTYRSYIIDFQGYDFELNDGVGYFVYVNQSATVEIYGEPLYSTSVQLLPGWNSLGWYQDEETTASSLSDGIDGCLLISWFDSLNQTYRTHITSSNEYDFSITQGIGVFVYTTEASMWHGD